MTEPTPQPVESKRKGRAPDTSIEQLQKLVEGMSQDERDRLERAGVIIPTGAISAAQDDTFKWGVRCTHCNQIALYLIGETWVVDGQKTDMPPPLPHHRLMWTQMKAPGEIDRHVPRCQHCGVPVALNRDGSFNRERDRVIRLDDWKETRSSWQQARDQSIQTGRSIARKLEAGSAQVSNESGVSSDYSTPKEPVSQVIARQRGGDHALDEIAFVAQQTGADQFGASRR